MFDQLVEAARRAQERLAIPGLAVGLLADGEAHVAGLGVTSSEHPLAVDGDTLFQIGSITKTYTATLVMRLVEQGKLDLDAPVRTYLPNLRLADPDAAARVTLRHLLSHTGGWHGDYFEDTGRGDDALARYVDAMVECAQISPLGELFSYNNAGFSLAGRVVEVVAGQTFERALRDLLLDPLGLTRTSIFPERVMTHRFAVGHGDDGAVLRPWHLPRSAHPAGGIITSAREQLGYARFWCGDGTAPDGARLLSPESMAAMQQPIVPADRSPLARSLAWPNARGLGWIVTDAPGVRILSHGGGTHGQASHLAVVPSRGVALSLLTNSSRGGQLAVELLGWFVEHVLGLRGERVPHRDLAADQLAPYAGRYRAPLNDVEVTVVDGALRFQGIPKGGFPTRDTPPGPQGPPVTVAFHAEDAVVATDGPFRGATGQFVRREGRIVALRWGGPPPPGGGRRGGGPTTRARRWRETWRGSAATGDRSPRRRLVYCAAEIGPRWAGVSRGGHPYDTDGDVFARPHSGAPGGRRVA
jgi:CubicO group peptidase (beta-lactamase class C family)